MLPKISIITITCNAEVWIERTVRSVLSQTYSNIEYIIVDGASTDSTLKIVNNLISENPVGARHASPLQQFNIISEPDTGIYDAMNKGLSLATGDYILFMNAGDEIYEPQTLENLIPYFQKNCDVIYGDMMRVDEHRKVLGLALKRPPEVFTWKSFRTGMVVCHQSILISREIAPKYDLQYRICADIDWIIRAMKKAKNVGNSRQIISRFLVGGFSQQREKKAWKERFAIMKKHYGLLQTLFFHVFIGFGYVFKH